MQSFANLTVLSPAVAAALVSASAVICAGLIVALMPLFLRYALVKPNARSSHRQPTPQGGGGAVIATTLLMIVLATAALPSLAMPAEFKAMLFATLMLGVVGMADDIASIAVVPRMLLQFFTIGIVLWWLPPDVTILPFVPLWLERILLLVAGVWFVNVVNFMDGIDWMTAAQIVPATAALALMGTLGAMPQHATLMALVLLGAMIGFAPFNRPVARLFLGDVGSLPIGLLFGWGLLLIAGRGHLAAAALLPLYYLADTAITLVSRLQRGEPVWVAHRSHFYQRATDRGWSVSQIVLRVFVVNVVLAMIAIVTVWIDSTMFSIGAFAAGGAIVALLLRTLSSNPDGRSNLA